MKIKKIITFILIIAWIILVFYFSNQNREKSSEVSGKVTEITAKTLNIQIEKQEQKSKLENKIRKLTHYGLYTIGGILILTHINLYNISLKKKILLTQIIGIVYALIDEFHQTLVEGRSAEFRDVLIDYSGILTGIIIVILIKKLILKIHKNKFNVEKKEGI